VSSRSGPPGTLTEHDVDLLRDPVFILPKQRATGDFAEFLADTFAAFQDRVAYFDEPVSGLIRPRSARISTLIHALLDGWRLARAAQIPDALERIGLGVSAIRAELHAMSRRHSARVMPDQSWYRLAAWPGVSERSDMFHAPFEIRPDGRPTPELGDVRFNG
jgi:hypothetical protein